MSCHRVTASASFPLANEWEAGLLHRTLMDTRYDLIVERGEMKKIGEVVTVYNREIRAVERLLRDLEDEQERVGWQREPESSLTA
jgi:hypothetical protein